MVDLRPVVEDSLVLVGHVIAKGRITVRPFGMPFLKLLSPAYRAVNK